MLCRIRPHVWLISVIRKIDPNIIDLNRKKIGGKWKPIILMILRDKPARFNKIKQLLPGVSGNMLTRSLKELERDRLIKKVDGDHVVYCLTDGAVQIVDLLLQIKLLVENL